MARRYAGSCPDEGLSDEQVRGEVLTMLAASTQTTATTMAWALHVMSVRDDIQDAVQAEVRTPSLARPSGRWPWPPSYRAGSISSWSGGRTADLSQISSVRSATDATIRDGRYG
jgi:hypothetical protein